MPSTLKLNLRDGYFREGSKEVAPANPHEGAPRRLALTADRLLTQPLPTVRTVPDVIEHAARKFPDLRAVGWRDVVRVHEEKKIVKKIVDGEQKEETKTWKYFELGDPQYMTFVEYKGAISEVARGLHALGIGKDDVVNIYAQTSVNWQLMSHGCALISTPIATSYETLGAEGLAHSINQPECRAIFTNTDLLPTLLKVLSQTPTIQYVFYDGSPSPSLLSQLSSTREGIQTLHIDDIRKLGKEKDISTIQDRKPSPEDLACIMYTSGSTGTPKGVQITHANLIASVAGVDFLYTHHIPPGTVYLAYLPLAHVLEYIVELCAVYTGATSVYARPKTLTDSSVRNCKGDLSAYKPTVLFGVPAVWETIRKGITGKVESMGWVMKKVVDAALEVKKWEIPLVSWAVDSAVLGKVRAATGGKVVWGVNGGAAISTKTQEFLSWAVMPLMQGYGMTESCGMTAILPPELLSYGVAGLPVPSVEIKLIDVEDMGYTSKNVPPQGEICIRGPSVTKGYFKRPDLDNDETVFTKDGWFRTGDIGQWNEDGTLSLIDRLKNLIKLQSGEYIALERLESIYKSSDFVANICIYASQDASQPIAIIYPNERTLRNALQQQQEADSTSGSHGLEELCKDEAARKAVLKSLNALAASNKLKPAEKVGAVVLASHEWTPENGMVTAAQKINRGAIAKAFKDEIKEAYDKLGSH